MLSPYQPMVRGVFVISKPAMVSSGEKLVLDGNVDIYENEKIVEEWLEKIDTFIHN